MEDLNEGQIVAILRDDAFWKKCNALKSADLVFEFLHKLSYENFKSFQVVINNYCQLST